MKTSCCRDSFSARSSQVLSCLTIATVLRLSNQKASYYRNTEFKGKPPITSRRANGISVRTLQWLSEWRVPPNIQCNQAMRTWVWNILSQCLSVLISNYDMTAHYLSIKTHLNKLNREKTVKKRRYTILSRLTTYRRYRMKANNMSSSLKNGIGTKWEYKFKSFTIKAVER